jgi:hypothetical protein
VTKKSAIVCLPVLVFTFFWFSATLSFAAPYFEDSFESGDLSKATNGVRWLDGANSAVSSDRAYSGTKSLKYTFGAGSTDAFAERRFSLGSSRTDVYIRFYVFFPSNYAHRTSHSPTNNKVIRLWDEEANYSTSTVKMGASFWAGNSSTLRPDAAWVNYSGVQKASCASDGVGPSDAVPGSWELTPSQLNRWLCFEFHFKPDTGSGNGAFEFWIDGQKQISANNLKFIGAPCSPGYFKTGYLLGAANSGFDTTTYIYIDDVVFSNTYIGMSNTQTVDQGTGPDAPKNVILVK